MTMSRQQRATLERRAGRRDAAGRLDLAQPASLALRNLPLLPERGKGGLHEGQPNMSRSTYYARDKAPALSNEVRKG